MECVILWRNNTNGRPGYISDAELHDEMAVFRNMDEAVDFAMNSRLLQAMPYQIVELDEL